MGIGAEITSAPFHKQPLSASEVVPASGRRNGRETSWGALNRAAPSDPGAARARHRCALLCPTGCSKGQGSPPGGWRTSRCCPQPGPVCDPAPGMSRHGLRGLFWLLESCANTGVSLSSLLAPCDAQTPSAELPTLCVQRPPDPASPPAFPPTRFFWGELAVRMRWQRCEVSACWGAALLCSLADGE